MDHDHRPELGYTQPEKGSRWLVNCIAMKNKRKHNAHVPGRVRDLIASHVRSYMERTYHLPWQDGNKTKLILNLARDTGVSKTTIQRAADPKIYGTGLNVDTLERLVQHMTWPDGRAYKFYELFKEPPPAEHTD